MWILALTAPLHWITFFCLFCLVYFFSVLLPLVLCDFVPDNLAHVTDFFLFFIFLSVMSAVSDFL